MGTVWSDIAESRRRRARVGCAACTASLSRALVEPLEGRQLLAADLASSFASALPTAVMPGAKNKLTTAVINLGDAPNLGGFSTSLYASADPTLDSQDTLLATGGKGGTLQPGRPAAVKLSFTAPASLPDGGYYLIARTDPALPFLESNTANNIAVSSSTVEFRQPFVDLTVAVPPLPAGPLVITPKLKPIKGSIFVTNNGNVPAVGTAAVTLLASLDTVADSSDVVLPGFGKAIKLKSGATKPLKAKITVPQTIPSGSYYLLADVAFAGAVAESNPADNTGASPNAVAIVNPSAPAPTPTPTPTPSPTPTPTPTPTPSPTATSLAVASGGSTIADDQAAPVGFEPAVQGQAAAARTFTVTNDGTGTLTLGSVVLPEGFALQEPLAFALAPGESDSFSVALDTTQPGTFGGAASFTTNVPGHETFDFPVGGAVTAPSQPTLASQLVINRNTIFIGDPKTVAFRANVAASSTGVAVAVYEVDTTGTDVGKVADLFDDGSASHGDSVAGDGVFNNTTAVSFDAPGSRRFVARMGTDVSGQTPVVVVTGATAPTDADLQAASDGAASVRQQVDAAIASGQPVVTALAEARVRLESDPTLAKPGSIDATRNGLAWQSPQGFICYIDADELTSTEKCSDPAGTATATATATALSPTASAAHVHTATAAPAGFVGPMALVNPASVGPAAFVGPADSCKKAIAINPFYFQFGQNDDYDSAVNILSSNGWRVETMTNETSAQNNVTPDTFKGLDKYGAVSISSHGETFSQYKTMINTGCLDTPASRAQYASDLKNHLVAIANGRTLAVLPEFIYTYNQKFDGTVVYVGACKSATDGSLANAFRNRGAAAFIGYTDNVEAPWAHNRAGDLWGTLTRAQNNTLADVPGINTLREPDGTPATFRSFGPLTTKLKSACEQLKDYNLFIEYRWDTTQRDLDTSTGFLGATGGYSCGSGSAYLDWRGDITTAGGAELVVIDLNAAYTAAGWQGQTTVSLAAGWYAPSNGKGAAEVTAYLSHKVTGEQRQVQVPQEISPGSQSGCASGSPVGTINVFAEGDPLDPAVRIALTVN